MKQKLLLAIACFGLLLTHLNCKKDNEENVSNNTRLLTERSWKLVKFEERDSPADPWEDITSFIEACVLDNIISFSTNGTFQEAEGASKCVPTDPDISLSGTWSFQSNETVIRLVESGDEIDAHIEILDANTLRYTISDPGFGIYLKVTMQH